MIEDILKDANIRMQKSIDALKSEFAKIRTGRAHPSLLEHVMVPYYGSDTPLQQVSSITISDARTLSVVPFEKDMVGPIEKAIMSSGLGLNPATSGTNIRIPMPILTEERRKEMVRIVRHEAEAAKVSIRNARRDAINDFKELEKEKEISEDDERRAATRAQALTDQFTKEVDTLIATKEAALMEV
jgi:ribosome recycling factor